MIATAATTGGLAGLAGGLSASIEQIAAMASKAGEDLAALGAALGQTGDKKPSPANPGEKPLTSDTSVAQPILNFVTGLEEQLKGLPEKMTGLLETAGKDALAAIIDPLKETAKSLLDSLLGGLFGDKSKDKGDKKDGQEQDKKETSLGDKINKNLKGVLDGLSKNLEGILGDLGKNFKGLFDGLSDSLGGLLSGIGGLFSGDGGGIFGTILGGITKLFGFAGGGRIQPGIPTIVGERGPELIVPTRTGTIMNGSDSRNANSGKSVSVNQTVNFDLVPSPTISAMIDAKKGEIERAAIEGTLRALNRGVI